MTGKIYKSAHGKVIDLGALILENENTRAVGNMGVNARGDTLDSTNQVIDPKNRQVQRQYNKQTNRAPEFKNIPVTASTRSAKKHAQEAPVADKSSNDTANNLDLDEVITPKSVAEEPTVPKGGLAAAIAKSKVVQQELLKTPRQLTQEAGVKKI